LSVLDDDDVAGTATVISIAANDAGVATVAAGAVAAVIFLNLYSPLLYLESPGSCHHSTHHINNLAIIIRYICSITSRVTVTNS
jgi:hypothetical protein